MAETFFFSQSHATRQILVDFALRLNPALSVEYVVLSKISANLQYKDGRTFSYTLDPDNFKVIGYDELQSGISLINGSHQARRTIYEIRDETGVWHAPIGTTCIFKDILNLEKGVSEIALENTLLDGLTEKRQNELLQQFGDDLRGYGAANGLHELMITDEYMRSLTDDDPARRHLQALIHQRAPLSREALKLLRRHAKQRTVDEIQAHLAHHATVKRSRQATVDVSTDDIVVLRSEDPPMPSRRLVPVEVTVRDPNMRSLSFFVLDDYRSVWPLIIDQVNTEVQAEARRLSTPMGDLVKVSLTLYEELQRVTGDLLTTLEAEQRYEAKRRYAEGDSFLSRDRRRDLLNVWDQIEPYLPQVTVVQRQLWRQRLHDSTLIPFELSELNDAFRKLEAAHRHAASAELARQNGLRAFRWIWRNRYKHIAPHADAVDASLLQRMKAGWVTPMDQTRLLQLRTKADRRRSRPPQSHLPKSTAPVIEARPDRVDGQAGLDQPASPPIEMGAPARTILLQSWPYVAPLLGKRAGAIRRALDQNRCTAAQVERLNQISKARFPANVLGVEERQLLLANTDLWRTSCSDVEFEFALNALQQQTYHLPFLARYREWLKAVLQVKAAEVQRSRLREQHTSHLHKRLMARWAALNPERSRQLQQIDPLRMIAELPDVCDQFAQASSITLEIEQAVLKWLGERI